MDKETLKTHALMLLNMYGVKEKDIKDRPECLNVFLNEIKKIREQAIKEERERILKEFNKQFLYFDDMPEKGCKKLNHNNIREFLRS